MLAKLITIFGKKQVPLITTSFEQEGIDTSSKEEPLSPPSNDENELLCKNWIEIAEEARSRIAASLIDNYFGKGCDINSEIIQVALQDQLNTRLAESRIHTIPWLNRTIPLQGAEILEIGCGTGSSTVALAEQGAIVTAIDVEQKYLEVARTRCQCYGLAANIEICNATEIAELYSHKRFDLIIFFASLEHMTHPERIYSISQSWQMLDSGKFWCTIQTPNRLWHYDHHSSLLPFLNWLPYELAFEYTRKFSTRDYYKNLSNYEDPSQRDSFTRFGTSLSFHELELAIGLRSNELDVVSYLEEGRMQSPVNEKYIDALSELYGSITNKAFLYPSLDLIIRKA